jgi:dTDP-4-amino-4,6-dideoxygalactose transaminase
LNLQAEYEGLKDEIDREISDVLTSGRFILGEKVDKFEEEFARYLGVKHVVSVNSGTSALYLALRALKIGTRDEVITAANTFVATCEAIAMTGATPRLVDVLPSTLNIDPDGLERSMTARTKAVVPVHLYGLPAEMDEILRFARGSGVAVVEDAAQAHGAECVVSGKSVRTGCIGDLGCFSFYPSKNLGCYGEGGAVSTNSDELSQRVRMLRDHGQTSKNVHTEIGGNYRMSALQGAVLSIKLKRLDAWNERRRELATVYSEVLSSAPVTLQKKDGEKNHVYHLYVIQTDRRNELREYLKGKGIDTGIHYPTPVHLCPAFHYLGYQAGDFPNSEALSSRVLSLPMHPGLTNQDVRCTARLVADFFNT